MEVYTSLSGNGNPIDNPQQWSKKGDYNLDRATGEVGAADPGQRIDLPDGPAIPIDDVVLPENASDYEVLLTGISAGCDEQQPLRVSATSDNPNLLPDPRVEYASDDSTGLLWLNPGANLTGTARVAVTVEDGGPDGNLQTVADNGSFSRSFIVTVAPQPADWGDAGAPYPTLRSENGAGHRAVGPVLGNRRNAETDAMTGPGGDGADEDGVQFGRLTVGQLDATLQVHVE